MRSMMIVRRVPTASAAGSSGGRTARTARRNPCFVVVIGLEPYPIVQCSAPRPEPAQNAAVRRHTTGLILLALVAGCGTPAPSTPSSEPAALSPAGAPSAPPSATAGSSASVSSAAPTTSAGAGAGALPEIALERVSEDLDDPINITFAPEGWLLVNERPGRVIALATDGSARGVVVDLTDRVGSGGSEQGLLGLALHPDWPTTARAFVHYTDLGGDTVLSELSGTPGSAETPPTLDATSERVLLQEDQPFPNHNGGQLAFGPDGHLYLALGDGGAGGDPLGHGQNPSTRLGAILRLDVSTPGELRVPSDNPFESGEGGAPEVFLFGLRNPWRFSFDPETELLWIGDVGQNAYEEVNRVDPARDAGANLGWSVMEASHCFGAAECDTDGLTMPIVEYPRDVGCTVIGGHVYRGDAVAALRGWYVFADFCGGPIFGIPADAPDGDAPLPPTTLLESGLTVSTLGVGPDGELYVADLHTGAIYRIVAR
jgi:glucose/arabinose dehydrogenase